MDEPTKESARNFPSLGWQGFGHQVRHHRIPQVTHAGTLGNSYYLSSHHIDICCWILQDIAIPTRVVASAATGIATSEPYNCVPQTEDTITLLVDWQSIKSQTHRGTGVYTASWTAPLKAGVHSAQQWYYMAEKVGVLAFIIWLDNSIRPFRETSLSTKRIGAMTSPTTRQEKYGTIHSSAYPIFSSLLLKIVLMPSQQYEVLAVGDGAFRRAAWIWIHFNREVCRCGT
jgi:hypothetical protein